MVLGRLLLGVALLALGAFAGAVLTLVHQATVRIDDWDAPWGLAAALAITAALLAGVRLMTETRMPAACLALGLLAMSLLLALPTSAGSVLVPATTAGWVWTFGPVLIAAVVLGWPRLRAARR